MLENLARRLLAKEMNDYSQELFIESINMANDLSMIKRMSLINECGTSCSVDNDLDTFKQALLNVSFPEDSTVNDRKEMLHKAVTASNNVLNEDSYKDDPNYIKVSDHLKELRTKYIQACDANDEARKNMYITQIKSFEKIKNDIKGGYTNV